MHWIWDNRQWLFSGFAVAVIAFVLRLLLHRSSLGNSNAVSADRNSSVIGSLQASGSNITQNIHIGVQPASTQLTSGTNAYSEHPTPDEIFDQLKRLPVYQQALVKDSFLGLKVRWPVKFANLKPIRDAEQRVLIQGTHDLDANSSEWCGVSMYIDIGRFPRLKVLHKGTPIQMAGEISYVSDDCRWVRLKDGDITFDDFSPDASKDLATKTAQASGELLSAGQTREGISEIRFDYLPERYPEQEGWELEMDQGPNRPTFSMASDPPGADKCLKVQGTGYRLDYTRELQKSSCNTVQYCAKLADFSASVVYAQVRMRSKDGRPDRDGWIAHKFDTTRGAKKLDEGEWTLTAPGTPLANTNWRSFRWFLPEEVEITFGAEGGWFYKSLLRIRLRGPLSITPIRLLR